MSLSKKIILSLIWSIFFITIINIVSFYLFYTFYLKLYLSDKITSREKITIDYINEIIEKQTIDEIENIFNDVEVSFFELLEKSAWKISLDKKENIDIVIDYLIKAWVSPKYIENISPEDNLEKVIENLKKQNSPESIFLKRLIISISITNLIAIIILTITIFIFTRRIILPIKQATNKLKSFKIWKDFRLINYNKKDEIGLLVNAINELNTKLNIGENIRNKLLADISHELKTPITSIQCYLEWIKDNVIKLDDKVLSSIINEMQRLVKLVNKIMEYEKFEASEIKLNITNEDVRYIIEQIIKQFKQKLKENNQKIITLWLNKKLNTDKDSFVQIVQNIISNFIKYSWENTTLKIEFWVNFIRFYDNWNWISRSELPYIKEKFYQWKNKKYWDIENRWIWIWFSIIEKIVKALNWELEIVSEEWKWFEVKILTKTSH